MRRNCKWAVPLFAVIMLAGCATIGGKPWAEKTPDQKALSFVQTWNAEDLRFREEVKLPGLTKEQKDVLRAKQEILVESKPLIVAYVETTMGGGIPSPEVEALILRLINRLTLLAIR